MEKIHRKLQSSSLGVLLLFFCCQHISSESNDNIRYEVTSDTLSLDKRDVLSLFSVWDNDSGEQNYFLLYRPKYNEISIVDLTKKFEITSFKVPKYEEPDSVIGKLVSFYYYNRDSIFLLHEYQLSIIDTSQHIKFKKIINNPYSDDWPPIIYGNFGRVFPICFDAEKKQLLIRQHCGECGNDTSFFRTNVAAVYDFKRDTFMDLNVPFPEKYKTNYYGDAMHVFREIKGDSLIFTFNADPYVTIFNKNNAQITKVYLKSKFQKKEIKPLDKKYMPDINKRVEHLAVSPLYMKLIYDKYKKLFYRFFLREQKLKNANDIYNTFGDKELVIMVLDSNLKLIFEFNLGKGYLWHYSFVDKNGLHVLKDKRDGTTNLSEYEKQKIQFDVINISPK